MGSRYQLPSGARLRVLSMSGRVLVTAEERDDIEVEQSDRHVEFKDGGRVVEVKSKSGSIDVRCPSGLNVSVGAMSGSVKLDGRFGTVKVSTVSGGIEIDTTEGDVDARCASGSISVKECRGQCTLHTKSGRLTVGRVDGSAHAFTVSGGVELGTTGHGEVEVHTVSGGIAVKVLEPRHPRVQFRSLAGKLRCDCVQGSDFELKAKSISGSLKITGE